MALGDLKGHGIDEHDGLLIIFLVLFDFTVAL